MTSATLVTRDKWGAKYGQGYPTSGPKLFFFVHHTAVARPPAEAGVAVEAKEVQEIEEDHAVRLTPTNPRIGYSFLIAQSGRIFEGCGWGRIGAHTVNHNSSGYGVCFMMNGMLTHATPAAREAFDFLRMEGLVKGFLSPSYLVKGHRDIKPTLCPGNLLYQQIVLPLQRAMPKFPEVIERGKASQVMPTLRLGKGGKDAPPHIFEAVRELQRLLGMSEKFRTGFFGDITDGEVRAFQRAKGLKPDGIVGLKTWGVLLSPK